MLSFFNVADSPDWHFYVAALVGAVVILAFRVAWLEVHRIRIDGIDIQETGDARHLMVRLKNKSFKNVDGLKVSIVSSEPQLSFLGNPTALPIVLTTQQRLQRQRSDIEPVPRRRFSMPAWDTEWIEILRADNGLEGTIDHENGHCRIRMFMQNLLTLELNGAGGNIRFGVYIISGDQGRWNAFLIRDKGDLCALEQLGLTGWW